MPIVPRVGPLNPGDPEAALVYVSTSLALDRCPHCGIAKPYLPRLFKRENNKGELYRRWGVYECSTCGGLVTAAAFAGDGLAQMRECYPQVQGVSPLIPNPAREYLKQAQETLSSAAGSIMCSASAVDAMLKKKQLKAGSLYDRINKAHETHLITGDMAKWAHQVRLDANDQRHADEAAALPTQQDAKRSLDFALALADLLFILPSRVTRGIEESKPKAQKKK